MCFQPLTKPEVQIFDSTFKEIFAFFSSENLQRKFSISLFPNVLLPMKYSGDRKNLSVPNPVCMANVEGSSHLNAINFFLGLVFQNITYHCHSGE